MTTDFDPFKNAPWMKDGPVQAVDPADLKSVWAMQENVQAGHPAQQVAMAFILCERACRSGANVEAVWYRLSMFRWLQMVSQGEGFSLPAGVDGKPVDGVFRVLASMPMTGLPSGGQTGLRFDVEEFIGLIK